MRSDRPRSDARAPAGALAGSRAVACLAALALAAALPVRASDLTGRAEVTYGEDDFTASSRELVRQTYLLDYRRQVTPPTSYQLTLRYQDERGSTWVNEGDTHRLRLRAFTPSGAIEHRMEDFGFTFAYRRNEEATLDPALDRFVYRSIERYSGNLYVRPFERGDVIFAADRLAFSSRDIDTVDQRFGATFRYTSEALRLVNEFRLQRSDDHVRQHSRVSIGPRLSAFYTRGFGPRYAMTAQYVLDYFLTQQDARARTAESVAVEVQQPAAGLYAVDSLPADTDPMTSEPRLVDRDLDASAGISIGPGGAPFQNIGLDMGRFETLDELRVHVRDRSGVPVPFDQSVIWTMYSSQDGLRWAEVSGSRAEYSAGLSAYVIDFPPTAARYFKVVNFREHAFEAFVTELQPFVHQTIQPETTQVSSAVRQAVGLTLTARPAEKVLVLYSGLLNADVVAPDRGPRRWFTDASNAANAKLGPYGDFLYGLGQTFTMARDPGGLTQNAWATSASVRYQPIPRYDTTFEARVSLDRFERAFPSITVRTVTSSAILTNRLDVYDSLRLGLNAGANRQELAAGGRTDFVTASAYAHAELMRNLTLRLDSSVQRTVARRGDLSSLQGLPIVRITTYEIYTAEARYQASSQLALTARGGWAAAEAGEGVIQSYRATWSPFPGGTLHLSFDYSEDVDPLTGQSFRRIAALPRWNVNRHAVVQLSYNNVRGTGPTPVRQQNLFMTLSLSL